MYAIYGNIYHQYTPNVSIYTMDPMGLNPIKIPYFSCPGFDPIHPQAADSALSTALAEPRSELKALRADPGFPGGSRLSDHDPFGAGYIEV